VEAGNHVNLEMDFIRKEISDYIASYTRYLPSREINLHSPKKQNWDKISIELNEQSKLKPNDCSSNDYKSFIVCITKEFSSS
jgi:hypothetical protein